LVDRQGVERRPSTFGTPHGYFLEIAADALLDPTITSASAKLAVGDDAPVEDWGASRMTRADLAVVFQKFVGQSACYR